MDKYGPVPVAGGSGTASIIYNFGPGSYKIGTYYNYCAATLGSYCYGNDTSTGSPSGDAVEADICPASWELPLGGENGNFQYLYDKISKITTLPDNATNLLAFQTILSTPVSGRYNSGTGIRQGTYGVFWSSIHYNTNISMYGMTIGGTIVKLQDPLYRSYGPSVRCIAQQ